VLPALEDNALVESEESVPERHFFGVVPVFLVDDVVATAEHYRDALGFEIDFVYGEEPMYSRVTRGDAVLDFSLSRPPGRRNSVTAAGPGGGVDALVVVNDVDGLYQELIARGAKITRDLASHEYGMREFHTEDINGYVIVFTQEIEGGEEGE
jgi:uncharacterized glyoxalase superfamily protein PhnB